MWDCGIRLRKTKTSSGATAVQAVRYVRRKMVVVKHFGSAHTPHELHVLVRDGETWVAKQRSQLPLPFDQEPSLSSSIVDLDRLAFSNTRHIFAHEVIMRVLTTLGFTRILNPLLCDLVVMRLLEPSSKLRAIKLLRCHFGIVRGRRTVYRALKAFSGRKDAAERQLVACAVETDALALSLVLYDVTTLYFESFREDEPEEKEKGLRKTGFSKDNKPQQPQIVVGLLVTNQGFPLAYDVFRGNTFEGHTMLPLLTEFQEKHDIHTCTVVADAAMLSLENTEELRRKKLTYIVGARVANLSQQHIEEISAIGGKDGATMRLSTHHGDLICSFSKDRYRKDRHEMEKQIARAKKLIASMEPGRQAKFVRKHGGKYLFNEKLVKKTEKLLGIKGYVTNISEKKMSSTEVIEHYRNLWRVEQSFRMSKHDLRMRPIFHRDEDAIRAHVLLCVVTLAIQKHLEQTTECSLRHIRDVLMSVMDITLTDTVTGRSFVKRSALSEEVQSLLEKLEMSY